MNSGAIVAVDHIDLEVQNGEFFSLLGPSGCGKTTTLRMIGGFEQPTSGLIELAGQDVTWLPPYKRNVNTVFQSYALFPHLTIFDNVAFGLRRRKVASDEIKTRVREMLELVELPGYENRKPGQLSGGQAQRVALARALVNKPSVLLLDEPLGALDLKLRKQMQVELKRIQQDVGITFIYVTHDQEEAMTMSDRIAVMNKGKYEQLADPETLYERPATEFVASFLGVSNLLGATIGAADGDYHAAVLTHGATIRIPSALRGDQASMRIGVRPEKIRLYAEDAEVPAQTQSARWRGRRRLVSRRLDELHRPLEGWGTAHRLRAEPDPDVPRIPPPTGPEGPGHLVARPHLCGPGRRARGRSRLARRLMTPASDPPKP